MVFTHRLTIISGGPGTGKTSIISRLLMILSLLSFNNNDSDIHSVVRIATPTGKSATRLNDSINLMTKKYNNLSNFYNNHCSSVQAVTLHRLLGMYFNKTSIQRTQNNFLGLDYLILDESSMIDLSMMAKIVTILPSTAKIIFFGDHKQLASVEPGSVFSDLCYFIGRGYTLKFLERLKDLTNYILPVNKKNKYNIVDSLCLLKKNYRFSSISGVGKLAKAVSLGNAAVVLSLLTTNSNNDLDYIVLKNDADYFDMLMACAFGYIEYLKKILSYNHDNLSCILDIFNQYRVLCALRQGPFGVLRLNSLIENILHHYGLIQLKNGYKNYVGRPIIITSNSPSLSLFNGEVGVILPNNNFKNSRLFAYFLSSNGNIKKISLHELPTHETNFVMTIHKSQGSEFKNIALIFPNKIIPMLNRELLYTGITRACKRLSIYATDQVINYSIHNECKRYSGLIDRLKQLEQDSLK